MGRFDTTHGGPLDGVYHADNGNVHSPFHTHNSGKWGFDIHHPDGSKTHANYLGEELNQMSEQPINQW